MSEPSVTPKTEPTQTKPSTFGWIPAEARFAWWVFLIGFLIWFLGTRWQVLVAGKATTFDTSALAIFIALALAPLFTEISFLGVTLKHQIESVKEKVEKVDRQLTAIKTEITVVNHHSPPPATGPELSQLKQGVQERINELPMKPDFSGSAPTSVNVPEETTELFKVRYKLEQEVRRLWLQKMPIPSDWPNRPLNMSRALAEMVEAGILDRTIATSLKQIYLIASTSIHGYEVSASQMEFVRDQFPKLTPFL